MSLGGAERDALDHDAAVQVYAVVADLEAAGVARAEAIAAVRRAAASLAP